MKIPTVLQPYVEAGKDFVQDDGPQAAAALSFYAVSALPPLVVFTLGLTGLFYSTDNAAEQLANQVSQLLGPSVGQVISTIVETRPDSGHGFATFAGLLVMLVSASGFFSQLQKALNQVWEVRPKPGGGIKLAVKSRAISVTVVLGTGFLFVTSLLMSTWIATASTWLENQFGIDASIAFFGQAVVSIAVITGLFAMIFKVLPDVRIDWKDVWSGAFTTAALFVVVKYGLAWYLGRSDLAASYGGAGALVLVLFWVYFSSIVMLYGAELTQVKAREKGRQLEPEPHAERVPAA